MPSLPRKPLALCRVGRLARQRLSRFSRNEDGSIVIFSLFLFLLMLIVGGMAVDVIHFEAERGRLQATLDRAVLAAADMEQSLDPQAVVEDFFTKAGLRDRLTSVSVETTLNSRRAAAQAQLALDTMFMRLVGVESLDAQVTGQAEESKSAIEVVLVLDVSSSMYTNDRIGSLRIAAANFVQTVLRSDTENRISVAVVPFDASVNLGPDLLAQYNITHRHGVAGADCVDLPLTSTSFFDTPAIPTTLELPQTGYFDNRSTTSRTSSNPSPIPVPEYSGIYCRIEPVNLVRLPSNNIAALQEQVRALKPTLGTSITAGMKWGLALIDPGTRPVFDRLIGLGKMSSHLRGRPFDYRREDTIKVIVLMTDGEHSSTPMLRTAFRSGPSIIYRAADGRYSIFHKSKESTGKPYWVPHLSPNNWQVRPWNGAVPSTTETYDPAAISWASVTRLNWNQVWSSVQMSWVATQLYANPLGGTWETHRNSFIESTSVSRMNSTLGQSCTQARNNGVIVYAINLEAPGGEAILRACASSPSTYTYTTTGDLVGTFESIAASISALRLSR